MSPTGSWLLAALLVAAATAAEVQLPASVVARVTISPDDSVPISWICPYIKQVSSLNHTKACELLGSLAGGLMGMAEDVCADPTDAGYGQQLEPPALSADGAPAPRPLTVFKSLPAQFNPDGASPGAQKQFSQMMAAEAPTMNWMWQVVRNIKWFWPCSRPFGGSMAWLVPQGWEMVGSEPNAPGLPDGLYTTPQDGGRRVPAMAVLRHAPTRQLVVAVRGTTTAWEWKRNFMYNRTAGHAFSLGASNARFPGEAHAGFTRTFDELWPAVRSALEAGAAGGWLGSVTFAGHSQGAAVATLLSYAAQAYLDARVNSSVRAGLVAFGCPNVGNSALVRALNKAVNIRRLAFENDPVAVLPCASKAGNAATSMPACADAAVPTTVGDAGTATLYWSDYQASAGEVAIRAASMPVQADAWVYTNHVQLAMSSGRIAAVHSCPYACAFRSLSAGDTRSNNCLLHREPASSPLLASNGYCYSYPDDETGWPQAMVDRQLLSDTSVFPATRPPLWDFRKYGDALSWHCGTSPLNVLTIDVAHAPIPGVTPEMAVWLFNNLQGSTEVDGIAYPNFLLFHPRDHVYYWASRAALDRLPRNHSVLDPMTNWREFQATGCTETGSAAAPYTCPRGAGMANPGVTSATPPAEFGRLSVDPVNSSSVVRNLDTAGITLGVRNCKGSLCAWTVRMQHAWRPSADGRGLLVTSHTEVGLKLGLAKNRINPALVDAWRNGVAADKKCQRVVLHTIEEWGALQHWLPLAHQQAQSKLAAAAAAAATVDGGAGAQVVGPRQADPAPADEALLMRFTEELA